MLTADDIDEQVEATEQDALAELLEIAKDGDAPAFWRAFKTRVNAVQQVMTDDPVEYAAWRAEVKTACSKVNVSTLDALLNPKDGEGSDSQATQLASLASEKCELWHDADGDAFASLERDGHREHWKIDSLGFRDWLAWLAHSELGAAPSSETLKSACNALSGTAKFEGDEHEPCRRVARDESGIWLDIADDQWQAIQVTATGWKIVANPPVHFLRNKSTRPLPMPAPGGNVDALWDLVNAPEEERLLILAWILETYRADTPYALLELSGEQGSAKSTTQTILRRFIDPNQVALRGKPKTVEDIFIGASNAHLLSYENLSGISNDQSDALCTCCTGGGFAARQLYTNNEESTLEAHCPVVLNGISPVVLRPDLLDRSISVLLPVIETRLTDDELRDAVEKSAPRIMGALLDLLSDTLAELPKVHIHPAQLPRMADFAKLGEAIARTQGYPEGYFLSLYSDHRKTAISRTIDASPLATAMVAYADRGNKYAGTVKGLLEILNEYRPDHERDDYWPRSPKGLADGLRRYAPALRQLGIVARVDNARRKDGVHCVLHAQATDYSCQPQTPGNEVHHVHHVHPAPKSEPKTAENCPQCDGSGCPLCWDAPDYETVDDEITDGEV